MTRLLASIFGQRARLGFAGLAMCAAILYLAVPGDAQQKGAKKKAEGKKAPAAPVKLATEAQAALAGKRIDHLALAKLIDSEIAARLTEEKIPASPRADDAEFIRRVSLDLVGVIPTAERVSAFLADSDTNKRAKLIDELLADTRFGAMQGEIWANLMLPRESGNRFLKGAPLQRWLTDAFNKGTPWNRLVADVVTASGAQDENGAVTYFLGNTTVDKITDNVTRTFMGVQLQCAQCHNHPFTDWKQTEYWGMAAFFMGVKADNTKKAAKNAGTPSVIEVAGKQPKGKKTLPESAKIVPAKFLQAEEPKLAANQLARPVLAQWMTDASNPFFAKAMANRVWHHFFGRGQVNPVDDMHEDNVPTHPGVLAALTEQLKANNFDVKYLMRAICNSATYQRTSRPSTGNESDTTLCSHMPVRVLSPEQLYDSLTAVVGAEARKAAPDKKANVAAKRGPVGGREQFISFFRGDEEVLKPMEYQSGIPQVLRLMNSSMTNGLNAAIARAEAAGKTQAGTINHLYLMTLSRPATAAETERLTRYLGQESNTRTAYGDILWAILNSSEFALNH